MEQKPHDTLSLAHTSWKCQYHIVLGGNKNAIARYIQDQEKENMMYDQLSLKEHTDPFKKN